MDAEAFSHNIFLVGFALTALASVAYAALPLWPRVAYGSVATDSGTTMTVATKAAVPNWLGPAATASAWLALAALTTSIAARWVASGRPPLSNMWEFTVAFGWGVILFYMLFELRARLEGEGWPSARTVGAFVLPVALGMFAVSLVFFPSEITSLVPALQSSRILGAHVTTIVLSYAALSVSFGAAVVYLIQGGGEGKRFARLPSGERLEEIANRSVLIGFPLLTLGVALGAYWAHSAWSRYWGWDPKETLNLWISGLHSYAGV
jgi:ABC-type transport system involved in cytochrome c biogenesis permease subunit